MSKKDELYHYGVKGMKWGKRKAIQDYLNKKKHAKRDNLADAGRRFENQWRSQGGHEGRNSWTDAEQAKFKRDHAVLENLRKASKSYNRSFDNLSRQAGKGINSLRRSAGSVARSISNQADSHKLSGMASKGRRYENLARAHESQRSQIAGRHQNIDQWSKGEHEAHNRSDSRQHNAWVNASNYGRSAQGKLEKASKSANAKARSFIKSLRDKVSGNEGRPYGWATTPSGAADHEYVNGSKKRVNKRKRTRRISDRQSISSFT